MTKHSMRMFGVSPFSSYKSTVKQKLIREKWDVGYLPAFVILCPVLRTIKHLTF